MTSVMRKEDILTVLFKGAAGAIPIAGPLFSEIIGATIPNQRVDLIEEFAKSLEKKLEKISKVLLQQKIKEPETVDLFEDALIQSTRALSQERIDYIASILKNSITQEELDHLEYKRLLSILAELNDAEIIILIAKSYQRGLCQEESAVSEFLKENESILKEKFIHTASPVADREKMRFTITIGQTL